MNDNTFETISAMLQSLIEKCKIIPTPNKELCDILKQGINNFAFKVPELSWQSVNSVLLNQQKNKNKNKNNDNNDNNDENEENDEENSDNDDETGEENDEEYNVFKDENYLQTLHNQFKHEINKIITEFDNRNINKLNLKINPINLTVNVMGSWTDNQMIPVKCDTFTKIHTQQIIANNTNVFILSNNQVFHCPCQQNIQPKIENNQTNITNNNDENNDSSDENEVTLI